MQETTLISFIVSVSQEFGSSLTEWFWVGDSHEVTVRWWRSLESLKISSLMSGAWVGRVEQGLEKIELLRHLSVSLCGPCSSSLQDGGFKVARILIWHLRDPRGVCSESYHIL